MNPSAKDDSPLADRKVSAGRLTGVLTAPEAGQDSTIPALTSGTLPANRHHNTFHAAAHQFDGFREIAFTDQLVKPFVSYANETGDVAHVDQWLVGTLQYAVVACY